MWLQTEIINTVKTNFCTDHCIYKDLFTDERPTGCFLAQHDQQKRLRIRGTMGEHEFNLQAACLQDQMASLSFGVYYSCSSIFVKFCIVFSWENDKVQIILCIFFYHFTFTWESTETTSKVREASIPLILSNPATLVAQEPNRFFLHLILYYIFSTNQTVPQCPDGNCLLKCCSVSVFAVSCAMWLKIDLKFWLWGD